MLKARIRQLAMTPLNLALYAAGRAYVPGYELRDALATAHRLVTDNASVTLGYFHGAFDSPERITGITHQIIDAVAALQPRGYLSIKAPALNYDAALLACIVDSANEHHILAHFDSHEHFTAEATMTCVRQAASLGGEVGLTIPGRWQRSLDDADEANDLGVRVRIVKGEWADPGTPHIDLRQEYLDVVDRLAGKARQVAIATHDPWLASESLSRLQKAGTSCELELLNGLPRREMLGLAKKFNVPVRFYIPFGIAWRPYALSKALENPRIIGWLMKDATQGLIANLKKRQLK